MTLGKYAMIAGILALSGCSGFDMQGHDPKDYYAAHPIANRVETRTATHILSFNPGSSMLSSDVMNDLQADWGSISPSAVESVQVQMHPSQIRNQPRRAAVSRALNRMGFGSNLIVFEPSELVEPNDVELGIAYAALISPRCPDWRMSPVTTYSNAPHANFGCATTTNLGLMVADPRDLIEGKGPGTPDVERNALVIGDYHSGKDWSSTAAKAGSDSGTAAATGDAATPAQ